MTRLTLLVFGILALGPSVGHALQSNVAPRQGSGEVGPWHAVEAQPEIAPTADLADFVDRAAAELRLGHLDAVIELLSDLDLSSSSVGRRGTITLGRAHLRSDRPLRAGELFDRVAREATGKEAGIAFALAARAYETAGETVTARTRYLDASGLLPTVREWLRLRAAALETDPGTTLELLADAPPAAHDLVQRSRAEAYLRLGDTVEAIDRYTTTGDHYLAAALSDSLGHDALTRELLYAAMARVTQREAAYAADVAMDRFPPEVWREHDLIARAYGRHGRAREAVPVLQSWIAQGDSSPAVFHLLGIMKEAAGDRWGALAAWETAARGDHARAGESEYRRIRLMVRMRRHTNARAALRGFINRFPSHDRTPWAMYLLGDLMWDAGLRSGSDSVFLALSDAFPNASNTSQARYRLAARALLRGDTAAAIDRFTVAASGRDESSRSSGYQLGVLLNATGDDAGARAAWGRLARTDSVGYYGMIARQAAGLPAPVFAPPAIPQPSAAIREVVDAMDLLDRIGLTDEAASLVDHTINSGQYGPDDLLSFAEALVKGARSIQGIRLGWRLVQHFSLNHPRIIRVIFPYPNRDLVEIESAKFGLDPFLVAGMIRQESAFDAAAVSRAGARGLMQLMPATARGMAGSLGVEWNNRFLNVADANVHLGTAHLAELIEQYDGEIEATLAAYNAGGRPVARWMRYPERSDLVRWIERIPYRETRGYLKTVLRNRDLYRALYGSTLTP